MKTFWAWGGKKNTDRRKKILVASDGAPSSSTLPLPDDVLSLVLEFVGPKQFRFIAETNRQLSRIYRDLYRNDTSSTMQSVAESASRCRLFMNEKPGVTTKARDLPSKRLKFQTVVCKSGWKYNAIRCGRRVEIEGMLRP